MKVNKRMLIIGVILGLITVFFLNQYIQSLNQSEEALASTSYSDVVVAQVSIPEHTLILENMVKIVSIPDDAIHPDAVRSIDEIVDGVTRSEIISGEQVLSGKVVTENIKANLAYRIPEDMRAMTLSVDEISGVANYIIKGDKIDILASYQLKVETPASEGKEAKEEDVSFTFTQLQNIEVLELGGLRASSEGEAQKIEQPNSITILVNPMQAEVLAFATLNGSMHFTLRNPMDNNRIELEHYSYDNFETYKER